jgi:hypothetical protein
MIWDWSANTPVAIGGEPFNIVQSSIFRWTDDGRAYFVALPTTAVNHVTGYLYELNAVTGQVRLVTQAWQLADVFGASPDGRTLIVNRPVDAAQGGGYALALVRLTPVSVPHPNATPTPTLSPAQAAVPPEALATAQSFMDARLRGDRDQALTFLAPDLQRQPPPTLVDDGQNWAGRYFIVDQRRDAGGRVTITVQISGPGGEFEQIFALEQRDGRWRVVDLGPLEKLN